MIDRDTKPALGRIVEGVQVVDEGRTGSWWAEPDSAARLAAEGGSG